jgi:hypothetical protein
MQTKPILCLSSGATPQYRLDDLRVLALPSGTDIQFRYGVELISQGIQAALSENLLVGFSVLLAHVDTTPDGCQPGQFCPITPCRYATLQQSTQVGGFYTLRFRLEEFAPVTDSVRFPKSLPSERPCRSAAGVLEGCWCLEVTSVEEGCKRAKTPEAWQQIVTELWRRKDFQNEPFFFTVTGIYSRDEQTPERPVDGQYHFKSDKDYEISILHFHPEGDAHRMPNSAGVLNINVGTSHLEAVTSSKLPIDSPYDLKSFHFRASQTMVTQPAAIVINVENPSDGSSMDSQPELYLPVKVNPSRFQSLMTVVFITLLMWAQQWLAATSKGPIEVARIVGLFVLALGTALVVVFGWKKI